LSTYDVISFCGVDGVGKSIQARLLMNFLNRNGMKVKMVWIRSPHTFAFYLWRLFQKFGFSTPPLSNNFDKYVWLWIEFFSIVPKILLDVKVPVWFGKKLVAERLVIDSIVTASFYFLKDLRFIASSQSNLLLRFTSGKTYFIHLRADPDIVLRRRLKRSGVDDQHLFGEINERAFKASVKKQQHIYKMMVEKLGGVSLDTTALSIQDVHLLIRNHLGLT